MNEQDLVEDIRQALDDGLDRMDQATRARLLEARRGAMNPARPAGAPGMVLALARRHSRAAILLVLIGALLAGAWFGLRAPPAPDNAELDILLLTDDIPPPAFADWSLVRREDVGPQCVAEN